MPRIAIPIPTSFDIAYNDRSWPQYAKAVEEAGGTAVPVPLNLSPRELATIIAEVDGVLLPGSGADVDPAKYGQDKQEACNQQDSAREHVDTELLQSVARTGKPLLGICFGMQSMNVFHGGTLVQDLLPLPVNHSAGRSVLAAHGVIVSADSQLAALVAHEATANDGFLRLTVNSSHHQAAAIAGDDLEVIARCPEDGVIEAVQGRGADRFLLGVQWHPERTTALSQTSRAIFAKLVAESSSR